MVKKKVKRTIKKRTLKVSKSPLQTKKDLELFAKGVERLKELSLELKRLDTRGFSKEEESIRNKLKNVSDIPNIERELRDLKNKINKKYKPKRKRHSQVSSDISELKRQVPAIKEGISRLSRKISLGNNKNIRVDSDLGFLVDQDFNDFLRRIKERMTERIKNKENDIQRILKEDLRERELKFREKHRELILSSKEEKKRLINEMHEKYELKIKSELDKDVKEKLDSLVKEKVDSQKNKIKIIYFKLFRTKANKELKKKSILIKKRLEILHNAKLKRVKKEFEEEAEQKYLSKVKNELDKEVHDKLEEIVSEKLEKEKRKFQNNYRKLMRSHMKEQISKKENILKKRFQRNYKDKLTMVIKREEKIDEMEIKLSEKFHSDLEKETNKKEKEIRSQLQKEFDINLKKSIQEHQEILNRKKLSLEIQLQNKMKQILN